jgi:hypothetical protein
MTSNQKTFKLAWNWIPDSTGLYNMHNIITYVVADDSTSHEELIKKAIASVIDSLYIKKDWGESRGPFTSFDVANKDFQVAPKRDSETTCSIAQYLNSVAPIVSEVSNMVVVASALDG